MAGRGPAPIEGERNPKSKAPVRGEWTHAAAEGWQHGPTPKPPANLTAGARTAWSTWLGSWFAYFWTPDDLPALRSLVRLYDQVERGEFQRHPELRLMMDGYGITPKGQQDRRWRPMLDETTPTAATGAKPDPYAGLQLVAGDK